MPVEYFNTEIKTSTSSMHPVVAHLSHLKHLAKPSVLGKLLVDKYGFTASEKKNKVGIISSYLEQALYFTEAAMTAHYRIKPVLQYYAYLNYAVSVVLCYKPANWEQYKKHGAEDLTRPESNLSLNTNVLKVSNGAIPLFHSVISDANITGVGIPLLQLLVPIPMISIELAHAFNIKPANIFVYDEIVKRVNANNNTEKVHSSFRLYSVDDTGKPIRIPIQKINISLPLLNKEYNIEQKSTHDRKYISKQGWTIGNKQRAEKYHSNNWLKLINYGGHQIFNPQMGERVTISMQWSHTNGVKIIPTMTASILLSYALSCICRYRSWILDKAENSSLYLLFDTFTKECDGYMIPAFRNLLYKEALAICHSDYY